MSSLAAATCGLLAAGAALGAAELAAALSKPQTGPLPAVGSAFIDLTPAWLKDFAIRTFGGNDKIVLLLVLVIVVAAFAAVIGLAARRHPRLAGGGLISLGLAAAMAALSRPGSAPLDVLPSLLAAVVGASALHLTHRAWLRTFATHLDADRPDPSASDRPELAAGPMTDRRALLRTAATVLGFAAVTGGLGRVVSATRDTAAAGVRLLLPRPADPAPPLPAGSDLRLPGLGPFTTPSKDFYRVDTALVVPRVPHQDWVLRIHGLVDRPVELTFDDILARPLVERDITMTCVSNEVGGPYVGHARWLGVDLADLLRQAGVRADADQILSRSADGWTCGTPVQAVLDGRDALLAVGMNGEVLPPVHGFPARMIVPGLYGYVSATKWVTEIKLTRFADERAYWTSRGWAEHAPVKTASRIELPKPFARLAAGPATIAGTAWAQHRGVAAVEVRVDGGPWRQARLAPSPNPDTWRQWHLDWQATPGDHRLEVRATDAVGQTQPQQRAAPFPDGATGWHSVLVTVL
ncbi:molybdopterin-dependent oxidoreductase [Streptosporangium sp. 'caverna']|uniref:molybdopterin-dependent oxidoreductase n=1 Tax=Streptosporangium sp. 'caverna' TaxID=2202249 RepID=UPI000D7E56F2|nr:molybdopterin-dependent oxidoreductase [Streptosporangium sp. 'caverna']AWS42744.1 molybdopterin-binding oxidoreductase [Streptosporangium sp. 'caverna']